MMRKLLLPLALQFGLAGAASIRDPFPVGLEDGHFSIPHRAKVGKDRWSSGQNRLSQKGRRRRARQAGVFK